MKHRHVLKLANNTAVICCEKVGKKRWVMDFWFDRDPNDMEVVEIVEWTLSVFDELGIDFKTITPCV